MITATARAHRRTVLWSAGVVTAASATTFAWDLAVMPSVGSLKPAILSAEEDLTNHVAQLADELVGVFGWSTAQLPTWCYLVWFAVIGGLVLTSLRRGKHGLAAIGWVVVATVYAEAAVAVVEEAMGWGTDSRYVLALAVAVPLLAAEIPPGSRLGNTPAAAGAAALAAVQLAAVWFNLRIYAVGENGPTWFLGHGWQPPGGQLLWVVVATLGAAALAVSGALVPVTSRLPAGEPSFGLPMGVST